MELKDLLKALYSNPDARLHVMLPDGSFVPEHFHVTEVGRVDKKFVDCGGMSRASLTCVLQLWVHTDTDHRLTAGKLSKILCMAATSVLGPNTDYPIEIEYENGVVSLYPLESIEMTPMGVLLNLRDKHTACLSPDKCGVSGC